MNIFKCTGLGHEICVTGRRRRLLTQSPNSRRGFCVYSLSLSTELKLAEKAFPLFLCKC